MYQVCACVCVGCRCVGVCVCIMIHNTGLYAQWNHIRSIKPSELRRCSHDALDHLASHRCSPGSALGLGLGRMCVSYLLYVGGFCLTLRFSPPVKLTLSVSYHSDCHFTALI